MTTPQEFRDFFAAIPDEKWCTGAYLKSSGACCAVGHLGVRTNTDSPEADALRLLFSKRFNIAAADINDGIYDCPERFKTLQTPKARIIAALDEIIAKESTEASK